MKKLISLCMLCLLVTITSNAKSKSMALRNTESLRSNKKENTKQKELVCWISEIVYHSDGTIDISIKCKEIEPPQNWATRQVLPEKSRT